MPINRTNRAQRGLAEPTSSRPRFLAPAVITMNGDDVEVEFNEVIEPGTKPIPELFLGTLKYNPGVPPSILPGGANLDSISIDNGGTGGAARIIFSYDGTPESPEFLQIPANWPMVRSTAGHWIAPARINY